MWFFVIFSIIVVSCLVTAAIQAIRGKPLHDDPEYCTKHHQVGMTLRRVHGAGHRTPGWECDGPKHTVIR